MMRHWLISMSRNHVALSALALGALLALTSGCGGGGGGTIGGGGGSGQGTITSVSITCPSGCTVQTGSTLQLTATVNGTGGTVSQAVTWSMNNADNEDGTVSSNGLYTAPTEFAPTSGSVAIQALASDGKTSGSVTVTVTQGTLPTLVVYTNDGCPTCTSYVERVYALDESDPATTQVQVSANDTPSQDFYATLSPDKTTVGYVKQGSTASVYTASVEGGSTPTLVKNWTDTHFEPMGLDWNPAGNGFVMAYADPTNGVCGLETVSLDGTTITPIPTTNVSCVGSSISYPPASPRYLSDGRIVYTANDQAFLLSADGTTKTLIVKGAGNISPSPDGTKIAFDSPSGIFTVNLDGTGTSQLLAEGGFPAWCPGGVIVFVNSGLYAVNADDSSGSPTELTSSTSSFPYCR
jgi:hypothetical protein